MLNIMSQFSAKASFIAFTHAINPHRQRTRRHTILSITTIWLVYSLFAIAFQCGLPDPWDYSGTRCHHGGLEYAIIGLDMLNDLYLAIFMIPTLWVLQTTLGKKLALAAFFGSRILYVRTWLCIRSFRCDEQLMESAEHLSHLSSNSSSSHARLLDNTNCVSPPLHHQINIKLTTAHLQSPSPP
jgi:hypothetical protein